MTDFARDELIDARRLREQQLKSLASLAETLGVLMDDRVRHLDALRKIAFMTETTGHPRVHQIAREAIEPASVQETH